jgi:hypothetical protein
MNKFQEKIFEKYIPEWQEIQAVIHEHWFKIVDSLILNLWLLVFIPSFLFYYSVTIQEKIPFFYFEIYLFLIYLKIIYDIFDWYNDVWLVTNRSVIKLKWALFNTKMESVNYENIEWIEVEQNWILDSLLNKWDIVIHKFWEEELRLQDASKPYLAIDIVEKNIEKYKNPEDDIDKFDLVMDTLAGVVKQYMQKKSPFEWPCRSNYIKDDYYDDEIIKEKIEKIKNNDWTIDLR